MAFAGIFRGLAQGSAQSLAQQLYAKQTREAQMREDSQRASDLAWRDKIYNEGERRWELGHQAQQNYNRLMLANAQKRTKIDEQRVANTKLYNNQQVALKNAQLRFNAVMEDLKRKAGTAEATQEQANFDAELALKQKEFGLKRKQFWADQAGNIIGGIGDVAQWLAEQQRLAAELKMKGREVVVKERQATTEEKRTAIDLLKAITGLVPGGGRGTGGTGSGGTGDPNLGVTSWSDDRSKGFVAKMFGPDMKSLNRPWIFPDRHLSDHELLTHGINLGLRARRAIHEAGITDEKEVKAALNNIATHLQQHEEFDRIRSHAPGDFGAGTNMVSRYMDGFFGVNRSAKQGQGSGKKDDGVSTIVDEVNKLVDGKDGKTDKALEGLSPLDKKLVERELKKKTFGESWNQGGALRVLLDQGVVNPIYDMMQTGDILSHYIGQPLGRFFLGGKYGQPPAAPTDISIKRFPMQNVPDPHAIRRDELNTFAQSLQGLTSNQLLTLSTDLSLINDPDKREMINVALRGKLLSQALNLLNE